MGRKVVLGVGNLLLKDEGVGIHVVQALADHEFPRTWRSSTVRPRVATCCR